MAVSLTAAQLEAALGVETELATRLLGVATELVKRYAPDAPDTVQNEAVIRTAGYLHEQPGAAIRSESAGDISTSYAATHLSALRHSGGMSLLSPWKQRRAGVI